MSQRVVETPRDTTEDLANEQHRQGLGKEGDKNQSDHGYEGADDCLFVTEVWLYVAADEDTDKGADGRSVVQSALPSGGDLVRAVSDRDPKVLLECGLCHKVADESVVVGFHDLFISCRNKLSSPLRRYFPWGSTHDAKGDHERPKRRLRIELESFEGSHVFLLLRQDGFMQVSFVGCVNDMVLGKLVVMDNVLFLDVFNGRGIEGHDGGACEVLDAVVLDGVVAEIRNNKGQSSNPPGNMYPGCCLGADVLLPAKSLTYRLTFPSSRADLLVSVRPYRSPMIVREGNKIKSAMAGTEPDIGVSQSAVTNPRVRGRHTSGGFVSPRRGITSRARWRGSDPG